MCIVRLVTEEGTNEIESVIIFIRKLKESYSKSNARATKFEARI